MNIREPAVAGRFYESAESWLIKEIETAFTGPFGPGQIPDVTHKPVYNIKGLISPHAGYIYSGSTAAYAYHRLSADGVPDTVILIGPNHRSYSPAIALTDDSGWRTPLGISKVDIDITRKINTRLLQSEINPSAHRMEHSLEVQIPFIQYIGRISGKDIKVVPISIGAIASVSVEADARFATEVGSAIADSVEGTNTVVIASTDFTHYKSAAIANKNDSKAIESILKLNSLSLLKNVADLDISMCGSLPVAITIEAAKKMGAKSASLLKYSTSGDITGDHSEVVGYASIELTK